MLGVDSAVHAASGLVVDNLYSFLPAKGGSGASTLLLAVATALAGPLKKRVLVIEADLRSGVLSFVLNQYPVQSIRNLLEYKLPLDEPSFQRYLTRCSGVDFLFSDRIPLSSRPAWDDYFALLEFARAHYDFILADLPDSAIPEYRRAERQAALQDYEAALATAEQDFDDAIALHPTMNHFLQQDMLEAAPMHSIEQGMLEATTLPNL